MKRIINDLSWVIVLFWTGVAIIYWRLSPNLANYNDISLHTSAYQIIKGLTLIGVDLLILLLGYFWNSYQKRESLAIKLWLNTLAVGLITCLIVAMSSNKLNEVCLYRVTVFDALFPIIRNSYPLVTGCIGGIITTTLIKKLDLRWKRRVMTTILILFLIPFFNTPNIWGWNDNSLAPFYTLLFCLGASLSKRLKLRSNLLLGGGCIVLNVVLQGIIPIFSINGGVTISRFTTPTNVLTVVSAYCCAQFLLYNCKIKQISISFIATYLVLVESSSLNAGLQLLVKEHLSHSSIAMAAVTIMALLLMLVIARTWMLVIESKWGRKIANKVNSLTSMQPAGQVRVIKDGIRKLLPDLVMLVFAYVVSLVTMLLMNTSWQLSPNVGPSYNIFAYALGQRELLLIMSTMLIFSAIKFFQVLTKHYWVSAAIIIVFNIILVVANREKIIARAEPILPSDIAMLRVAGELFSMVNTLLWFLFGSGLIILIGLTTWLEKRYPTKPHFTRKEQLLFLLLAPLLFSSSVLWNQQPTPLNNLLTSIDDQPMFYNQLSGARINGPLIQFLNNVDVTVMDEPAGYSSERMKQIVEKYQLESHHINRYRRNRLADQTIIFNLSESFANPQRVPGIRLKNNPIPFVTRMEKQATGGIMISSGYGGGTANMEYMTLTGFVLSNFSPTLPTPYTQLVVSLKNHPSIVQSFHHAVAIHPYNGAFYSRIQVYKKFGFNRFLYLGGKDLIRHQHRIDRSSYLSDRTAYDNVLDLLRTYQRGQFINLVTMQNHFPYDEHRYNNLGRYQAIKVSTGTQKNSVNDFTTGIHYTDNYIHSFIRQIDKVKRPITIVFYGDHLPGIYGNDMNKDGQKLHETDYFIYSNRYARQHGSRNLKSRTAYVTPNDFIAMVAKQTNSKVNWYQALLTAVYEKLPAVSLNTRTTAVNSFNSGSQFTNEKGRVVSFNTLTKVQKQIWQDYQLVQYDVTAGHHYVNKYLK